MVSTITGEGEAAMRGTSYEGSARGPEQRKGGMLRDGSAEG